MTARLIPLTSGSAPTITLQRPVLLLGRHPECDVRIDLPKVSRRHCCLALAYERVIIRDLGSRNGLRVNGLATEEARLVHGDEVAIGPLLYKLDDPQSAPPPPAEDAKKGQPDVPLPTLPAHDSHDLVPLD